MTEALMRLRKVRISLSHQIEQLTFADLCGVLSLQELKEVEQEGLFDLCLFMGPDEADPCADPFTWFAVLKGPQDSPYDGGTFRIKLTIPEEYPERAPKAEFLTKVFHPNISGNGDICLDILNEP